MSKEMQIIKGALETVAQYAEDNQNVVGMLMGEEPVNGIHLSISTVFDFVRQGFSQEDPLALTNLHSYLDLLKEHVSPVDYMKELVEELNSACHSGANWQFLETVLKFLGDHTARLQDETICPLVRGALKQCGSFLVDLTNTPGKISPERAATFSWLQQYLSYDFAGYVGPTEKWFSIFNTTVEQTESASDPSEGYDSMYLLLGGAVVTLAAVAVGYMAFYGQARKGEETPQQPSVSGPAPGR